MELAEEALSLKTGFIQTAKNHPDNEPQLITMEMHSQLQILEYENKLWFVLNCVSKSTEHAMKVFSGLTSPICSPRSSSSICSCCFWKERVTSSPPQHSCSLGCLHLLPSMSHPLRSLSPGQDGRGLPSAWPSCLCRLCLLQPSAPDAGCPCRLKDPGGSGQQGVRWL